MTKNSEFLLFQSIFHLCYLKLFFWRREDRKKERERESDREFEATVLFAETVSTLLSTKEPTSALINVIWWTVAPFDRYIHTTCTQLTHLYTSAFVRTLLMHFLQPMNHTSTITIMVFHLKLISSAKVKKVASLWAAAHRVGVGVGVRAGK